MSLLSFPIGFLCGFIGSVPVAGPIAALVFARALSGRSRLALGIAWGAALPEALVAALAAYGVGALLGRGGPWMIWGALATALILIAVGLWLMAGGGMSEASDAPNDTEAPTEPTPENEGGGQWSGVLLGMGITAVNPTLLVTWSSVSAGLVSLGWLAPGLGSAMAFGLGAGLGIGLWFTAAVATLGRLKARVSMGAILWVGRCFGALLLGTGLWGLGGVVGEFLGVGWEF